MTVLLFMFPYPIKTNKLLSAILVGNKISLLELEFSFSFYKPKELVQPKWKCPCLLPSRPALLGALVLHHLTWCLQARAPAQAAEAPRLSCPLGAAPCLVLPLLGLQEGSSRCPSASQSSHFPMSLPPQESSVGRQFQPLPLGHIWVCHLPLPHPQLLRIHQELSLSVLLEPSNSNWDDAFIFKYQDKAY